MLLYNPLSRHGLAAQLVPQVRNVLQQILPGSTDITLIDITASDFATRFEQACTEGPPPKLIVLMGGDGTVHSMTNFFMSRDNSALPPILILGLGTGNDIAKSLKLPVLTAKLSPPCFRHLDLSAPPRFMDVVRLNEKTVFVDMCSLGLEAKILAVREQILTLLHKYLGRHVRWIPRYPVYAVATAIGLLSFRPFACHLSVDGESPGSIRAINILIKNVPVHAGEFIPSPVASAFDGKLDLIICTSRLQFIRSYLASWRFLPQRLRESCIVPKVRQIRTLRWHSDGPPVPMQLDGELTDPSSAIQLDVIPATLPVVTGEKT